MKRRDFIRQSAVSTLGISMSANAFVRKKENEKHIMTIRYDTEWWGENEKMAGFTQKATEVHRKYKIPVTFFCCGSTLEKQKAVFREFYQEVKADQLFDFQDHSFGHVGLCKKPGEGLTFDEI